MKLNTKFMQSAAKVRISSLRRKKIGRPGSRTRLCDLTPIEAPQSEAIMCTTTSPLSPTSQEVGRNRDIFQVQWNINQNKIVLQQREYIFVKIGHAHKL